MNPIKSGKDIPNTYLEHKLDEISVELLGIRKALEAIACKKESTE